MSYGNDTTNPFDADFVDTPMMASPPAAAAAQPTQPPPAYTSSNSAMDAFVAAAPAIFSAASATMSQLSPSTPAQSQSAPRPLSGFGSNTAGIDLVKETLDESVWTTLSRDLKQVAAKMWQVLIPRRNTDVLRDWDLWGPLLLCLSLAIMLSVTAPTDQSALVFSGVFTIIWCGAGVVALNAKLLGGNLSFFQSVCVLGYCCLPLVIASLICLFVPIVFARIAIVVVAFAWSTYAALTFLSSVRLTDRRALALYPIFLFYFVLAWIILISKSVLG